MIIQRLFALLAVTVVNGRDQITLHDRKVLTYPDVKRNDTVCDNYFGNEICDPFRWLETPEESELKSFIDSQNKLTESYINDSTTKATIKSLLEEMAKYEKFNCPIRAGGKYYYSRNDGLQDQDVFYVQDSLSSEPKLFLDPNELSKNGTVSVYGTYFSHSGGILAYEVQKGGSDWITLQFKNTATGEDLVDKLEFLKFTYVEWKKDDSGVYYARYPSNNGGLLEHQKIYFHKMGTDQSEDILLVEFPENKQWFVGFFSLSHDGNYLVVVPADGIGVHTIYYADLDIDTGNEQLILNPVVTEFAASFEYITNIGTIFYFKTDKDSPNRKIVSIDVTRPEESSWTTIVEEQADDTLDSVTVLNENYLVLNYIKDVSNILQLHHLSNGSLIKQLSGADSGTAALCKIADRKETELFFTHTSYLSPQRIYVTTITNDLSAEVKIWKDPHLESFVQAEYKSSLVFFNSYDGTRVPMFISHRKDLVLNGELPTKLHAYGGYGVSTLPSFSWENAVFMKNFNGVLAVANIRGGGEYGKKWWDGGRLLNKQNGFNDFQAAAEYLIQQKYTNPSKLYIEGESNGGLMVAACLNQRPDLFGAVIADVGVMDMLRFQRFTIGHAWCSEFGCSDDEIHFNNLVKYSPLHNIRMPTSRASQYPPVLVLTADNDDRVLPLHSYKYISEMQYTLGRHPNRNNPLLLRVEADAGHGLVGKPITKQIEESRDVFAFLMQSLGYKLATNSNNTASTNTAALSLVFTTLFLFHILNLKC